MTREQTAVAAAQVLQRADLRAFPCVLGFDGFVDSIIDVVETRRDAEHYDRVLTIAEMAKKIGAAAGQSANYELVTTLQKLGGNGPIMANALMGAGFPVTYVGSVGKPEVHPVFKELAARAKVYALSEPGYTDALEFGDGKLMLGKHAALKEVTYEGLVNTVGKEALIRLVAEAKLIAFNNWTMLPNLTQIWKKLLAEVMPQVGRKDGAGGEGGRTLFLDLADPQKRTLEDLREALATLRRFEEFVETTVGLNLKEATQVAQVLGIGIEGDPEGQIEQTAAKIRAKLGIACVVVHPRCGAAAGDAAGTARFNGPFVAQPKISTGAGDHFNAGFCMGRMLGMPLEQAICVGTAVSGFYVRNAQSPTQDGLVAFLRNLPAAE